MALIGLGEAGATIHLPSLRLVNGVEIVGAADPVKGRRDSASAALGMPVFESHSELFNATQPDFVIVASPPSLHAEHCIAALDSGADVLCEKPFAASIREGEDILGYATKRNRRVAVNHEFRAMPIFRDLISAVREGPPPSVVQVWQAVSQNPDAEQGWRGQLKRRSLYEAGVHLVDLALHLFGEMPIGVSGSFAPTTGESSGVDAIVLVTLRFPGDRLAHLMQRRVHVGDRQYMEVRADASTASYRASFGGRARVTAGLLRSPRPHIALERGGSGVAWKEHGATRTVFSRNGAKPLVTATRDIIQSCVDAIRLDKAFDFSATDGVDSLRIIAAAYKSAETGRTVDPADENLELMTLTESRWS